ncbi:MAG TPA: C-GCAxxG-C-C family protein [Pelolinea sp.]|nr:C-GCAxxG-C-C family protein [Pelolinea sp.]
MDEETRQSITQNAGHRMDEGYHCSEAILLAVGGHYLGDQAARETLRYSTPFAGGVGSTRAELCGALAGGLMVIGGVYGREQGPTPDERCQALAVEFRAEFLQEFGWLKCCDLRENWIGNAGQESCRALVEKAAEVLVGVIEDIE